MSDIYFNSQVKGTNVRVFDYKKQIFRTLLSGFWRLMPGLTSKVIRRFFMATGSYTLSEEESACLDQGQPFQVHVGDRLIQGWKWGKGPAILMIHGWGGRGAQFHRFVRPIVEAGYTAVAIDGPGHGRSSGRTTNYFMFTDTVRALLSPDLGLDIRGLIGHSFGAAAIINGLEKEQLSLRSVCIAPMIHLQELLVQTFERFGVPQAILTAIIGEFETRYGYSLSQDNPPRLIGGLKAPVLIIHDVDDRSTAYTASQEQARIHGHVELQTTRGLGHRRILNDGEVIQAALEFIQGNNKTHNQGAAS